MKIATYKIFQKPNLGQNFWLNVSDIGRSKMNPKSLATVITDFKDD